MKKKLKFIKEVSPLWWKYFAHRNKGHKFRNLTLNAIVSFSYAFLNSVITKLIALKYGPLGLFFPTLGYYTLLLFSTKTMAFADNWGKTIFVIFSTSGFLYALYVLA